MSDVFNIYSFLSRITHNWHLSGSTSSTPTCIICMKHSYQNHPNISYQRYINLIFSLSFSRAQRGEPVRRGVRQRATAAGLDQAAHRRAGTLRSAAVRHLANPPGVQRLRVQDTGSVLRDWVHTAPRYRRLQAASCHPGGGRAHRAVQARVPVHLRLGDSRPAALRWCLQPG